jgi:uroporphyrinogen decarboxylase
MRQAGRSLPEYREVRKRFDLFGIVRRPEVCAEVTLQPVARHGVDAAVMFADIMVPVLAMGADVRLVEGVGPVLEHPVESVADVAALRVPHPKEAFPFVLDAVRLVRAELREDRAVVGFCGGPFTVAGYLVEGRPTRDFVRTKRCMYAAPDVWHALMEKLADTFAVYLRAQIEAGADVVQVFDSWAGALSGADYREFVAPYSARILGAAGELAPAIHFGTGTTHLLGDMAAAGGDVIGLDWRIPIAQGWSLVGEDRGVQGNLDPAVLLGPWERTRHAAEAILAGVAGRPGHVFNLGHGVLPQTEPDVLGRLVELVHERTATELAA